MSEDKFDLEEIRTKINTRDLTEDEFRFWLQHEDREVSQKWINEVSRNVLTSKYYNPTI